MRSSAATSSGACWTIYCDGSAFPNPGNMGLGAVLTSPGGVRHTLSEAAASRGATTKLKRAP